VPLRGEDLRVVVAGGRVVGAIKRVAPPGEWRTNVARGARRVRAVPPTAARALALAAADAVGADFIGVDLLPSNGGYVIIELNGCVDLTDAYALDGTNVFDEIAARLVAAADALKRVTSSVSEAWSAHGSRRGSWTWTASSSASRRSFPAPGASSPDSASSACRSSS
jgi:ribosomal protein S6--L-glutamate ligase